AVGEVRRVQRVVHRADPVEVGGETALGVGDGDEVGGVADVPVVAAGLALHGAVDGGDRGDLAAARLQRAEQRVVVDDVDVQPLEDLGGGGRVDGLRQRLAQAGELGVGVRPAEAGLRPVAAGTDE